MYVVSNHSLLLFRHIPIRSSLYVHCITLTVSKSKLCNIGIVLNLELEAAKSKQLSMRSSNPLERIDHHHIASY